MILKKIPQTKAAQKGYASLMQNKINAYTALIYRFISRETLMYLIFGVLTSVISVVSFYFINLLGLHVAVTNTISTIIAVAFAFVTNKLWVFESKSMKPNVLIPELVKFASGRTVMYFVETGLLVVFVGRLYMNENIAKIITTVIVIVGNYFISKKAVFTK